MRGDDDEHAIELADVTDLDAEADAEDQRDGDRWLAGAYRREARQGGGLGSLELFAKRDRC